MHAQDVTYKPGHVAIFLVFGLNRPDDIESIRGVCSDVTAFVRSMRNRFQSSMVSCVMGFGSSAWDHLFPRRRKPAELDKFEEIRGDKYTAPSTPGDIFFHIRSRRTDLAMELATLITDSLGDSVFSIEEIHGFRYFDGRAILGFVDGTENPDIPDEAYGFAVIGDNEPDFRGGSYCFVQKYIHDMKSWKDLPTEEQEKVIGRRKFTDQELSDEDKPANAHNAVTNITDADGVELKIIRANMPFANPSKGEFGTYFIGYASTFSTTKRMLENMFIGEPRGNYDRILDYSTAVTGTLFFIPSLELLDELSTDED